MREPAPPKNRPCGRSVLPCLASTSRIGEIHYGELAQRLPRLAHARRRRNLERRRRRGLQLPAARQAYGCSSVVTSKPAGESFNAPWRV